MDSKRSSRAVAMIHLAAFAVVFLAAWGIESLGGPTTALSTFKTATFWVLFVASGLLCHPAARVFRARRERALETR